MQYRRMLRASLALLMLSGVSSAWADDDLMLDTFAVNVGVFASRTDANLRVDANAANRGTSIDLNHDLGLGGSNLLPYIGFSWRPFRRHEFEFSYYENDESTSHELGRDISVRDVTYLAGSQVGARFSYQTYGAGYRYWAWIGDRAAFAISAGLKSYRSTLKLDGTFDTTGSGGSGSNSVSVVTRASTHLPDPYIGLSYRYQMTDWLRFTADGGAFKSSINDIDATLYDARAGLEVYPWESVGIVAQYAYNKIDADLKKDRFLGAADLRFDGAQLLLKYRF